MIEEENITNHANTNIDEASGALVEQTAQQESANGFVPKLYIRRWFVLLGYFFLTVTSSSVWFAFSAISNITQKYYGISAVSVNWLAMVFSVVSVVLMFPSLHFLEKKGLGMVMVMATFVNAIGCCIRYIGFSIASLGYWFLLIGNILSAISVSAFMFLPSKLAALWFGEKERATATSVAICSDSLGLALGYFLPTAMVKNRPKLQEIGEDIGNYLLVMAVSSCLAFIYMVIAVKDKPKSPPSYSESQKNTPKVKPPRRIATIANESIALNEVNPSGSISSETRVPNGQTNESNRKFDGYRKLLRNANFHIVLQLHGIIFAQESVFLVVLNEIMIPRFPGHEFEIGLMGSTALLLSIPSSLLGGFLLDRTRAFKKITIATTFLVSLLSGLLTMFFYLKSPFYSLFCSYVGIVTVFATYYTTALDHCAELTYPVSEARSGVVLLWLAQVYSFIYTRAAGFILMHFGAQVLLICILCFYALTFLLSLIVKDKGPRSQYLRSAYSDMQM